jgi:RES domain
MADPEPPSDLERRRLPLETLGRGQLIHRIHLTAKEPKFFGRTGNWRFDSPDRSFGTLHAALSEQACFVETLLRGSGRFVAQSELEIRSLCRIRVIRDLRLARLHGPYLARLAASAVVTAGPDYALSQRWARAIHAHPDRPDGILYRSNYDNDQFAVVLFDRAAGRIDDGVSTPLLSDLTLLGRILNLYKASVR